jgi:glycosyltransferase involved in cell wall biosynthesis
MTANFIYLFMTSVRTKISDNLIVINKPKRILVATGIYPPEVGGPATYSKLLKEELPKYSKDKVRAIILNFGEVRKWPKVIRHIIYFFKALYRGRYCEVIYAQDPVSVGLPALWAARVLHKPFLLKIVGDYAWEQGVARFGVKDDLDSFSLKTEPYGWFVQLLKKIEKYVAREADKIIVPSEYLKKIVTNWGISPDKIIVIYNSFEQPKGLLSKEIIRKKVKVTGELVVSAGRLVPWKGFDTLIKIWPIVLTRHPEAKLLIIGDGPLKNDLENLIARADLSDSILLAGQLERQMLLVYLKIADVFVLNTSYEGFSHQLLEVASVGTPIITTRVGGNPEIIKDGLSGLLVKYNDQTALINAIEKLLTDADLAQKLAITAANRVQEFSLERMITNLIRTILL